MSDHDPFDLVGQTATEQDLKEKTRLNVANELNDFKWLMSQKRGRRFIWRLLEKTHVFKSSMTGNSQTFFLEGERNIGLQYMSMLNNHCADDYAQMVQEQKTYGASRNSDDGSPPSTN